jgi:hypothetical protein
VGIGLAGLWLDVVDPLWYRDGTVADQEWAVVKSRVERELATALAKVAGEDGRSVSMTIRLILLGSDRLRQHLQQEAYLGR